jgi:hypothetical protein
MAKALYPLAPMCLLGSVSQRTKGGMPVAAPMREQGSAMQRQSGSSRAVPPPPLAPMRGQGPAMQAQRGSSRAVPPPPLAPMRGQGPAAQAKDLDPQRQRGTGGSAAWPLGNPLLPKIVQSMEEKPEKKESKKKKKNKPFKDWGQALREKHSMTGRDLFDTHSKDTIAVLAEVTAREGFPPEITIDGVQYRTIELSLRDQAIPEQKLFQEMFAALMKLELNYKNGPRHDNREGNLPAPDSDWRYIECYYAGGGTRVVLDMKSWVFFVSPHYGRFYVVLNHGQNPIEFNHAVLVEARILSGAYRHNFWDGFMELYPAKYEAIKKGGAPKEFEFVAPSGDKREKGADV